MDEAGVLWPAAQLLRAGGFPYDILIHMGLENETRGFEVEVVAANLLASSNGSAPAVPGGPALLPTTVDLGRILQPPAAVAVRRGSSRGGGDGGGGGAAAAAGYAYERLRGGAGDGDRDAWAPAPGAPPAAWSRDAGNFYCNEVYYRSLYAVRVLGGGGGGAGACRGALLPVMFVHLPALSLSPASASAALVRGLVQAVALSVASYAVEAPLQPTPAFTLMDMVCCGIGTALGALLAAAAVVFGRCRPGAARVTDDKDGYFVLEATRWDAS